MDIVKVLSNPIRMQVMQYLQMGKYIQEYVLICHVLWDFVPSKLPSPKC